MSILAVGSIAFDSIATPSGRVDNVLGGSATYFSLSASYFTDVRVVAVVGEDFTAEHENVLKKRNIDTRGIEHAAPEAARTDQVQLSQHSLRLVPVVGAPGGRTSSSPA